MTKNTPKIVMTYGTFDLFHYGHVRLLHRLADMGDQLIVGCSTDEFNATKGKFCVTPYEHRRIILEACRYVTKVIPEENWAQKRSDMLEHNVDVFAMGDDWAGKFDELSDIVEVVYLDRTTNISTTDLKLQIRTETR
ncbi:MAG: adenylyltransferase/cytidyltransferase family protein [Sulfitobacter sp.]